MPQPVHKYFPEFLTRFWLSSADGPLLSSRAPRLHQYDVYDNELIEIHQHSPHTRSIFEDLDLKNLIDTETRKELDAATDAFHHLERDAELTLNDLLQRTAWSGRPPEPSTSLSFDQQSLDNLRKYLLFLRFRNSRGYTQVIESLELDEVRRPGPKDTALYIAYRPYILLIRLRVIFRKFAEYFRHTPTNRPHSTRSNSCSDESYAQNQSLQQLMHTYCWRLCEAEVCVGIASDDQEFIFSDQCFGSLDEGFGEDPLCGNLCFPVFPTVAVYIIGLSDDDDFEPPPIKYSRGPVWVPVSTESAIDVHLRNAMLLQTYPHYLYFRSLRTVALSISSYDEFRWIQEHQDYSRLKQRCRQKFLQETVTKTLVVRDSITVTDLSDEITVLGDSAVGHGAFSDVWKGTWHDPVERKHRSVALKFLRQIVVQKNREKLLKRLQTEIMAWHKICHRNVIQFFGIVQAPMGIAMVSPWCENGTASSYLKRNPDANRLRLLTQAASGVAHLHATKPMIVHGDLRAGNILVDEHGEAIINDFGLSKVIEDLSEGVNGMATSFFSGSTRWMAPELILTLVDDTDTTPPITPHSDVYSFGCVCLEFATDGVPFPHRTNNHAVTLDIIRGVKPKRGSTCLLNLDSRKEEAFWRMVERCWASQPEDRPTMSAMLMFLRELE